MVVYINDIEFRLKNVTIVSVEKGGKKVSFLGEDREVWVHPKGKALTFQKLPNQETATIPCGIEAVRLVGVCLLEGLAIHV